MHTCAPILRAAGALILSSTLLAATPPPSSSSPPRASAPDRSSAPQRVDAPRASTPETGARRGYGPTIRYAPPVSLDHPGGPHAPAPAKGGWGGGGGGGWISFDSPWGGDAAIVDDAYDVGAPSDAPAADEHPIDTALRGYGLEPADCNAPAPLVVIDTPDHHRVCAFPNAAVRAGHYTLDRESRTLIPA
ncbi:MAG: hypothetical protein ABR975_03770 [Vulcanimicrobiaceae bacterium]|jgi:hypothetical protein